MTNPDKPGFDAATPKEGRFDVSQRVLDHQTRLAILEERSQHFATKEDLQKELHGMTWKIIGAIAALVAVVYWIARNVPMSN
ncbi:MAG TPA: hypothetical protein IAC89_01595 [Candidatus Aphodousia faecalis]|nr:hypothetical protein [Candidatus Aphodousia faecalis]